MKIYIITCTFNTAQTLIDCAFQKEAEAKAYAAGLNADRAKAVARCRELIVLREGVACGCAFYRQVKSGCCGQGIGNRRSFCNDLELLRRT